MEGQVEHYRFADHEAYAIYLSQAPSSDIVRQRQAGRATSNYSPVEGTEAMADLVYRHWEVIDEKFSNVVNEIVCTLKIQALPDYPGADYIYFTGSASKPIQCKSGSETHLFPLGKTANSLEFCLPAARSGAIRCAFSTLGNLFGRNLNRDEVSNDYSFDLSYPKQ